MDTFVGRYEVQIPVMSNEGVPFDAGIYAGFEAWLIEEFGGFTALPTPVRGVWLAPNNKTYSEDMYIYYLYTDAYGRVDGLARYAGVLFDQIAISVIYPNGSAKIVYNTEYKEKEDAA